MKIKHWQVGKFHIWYNTKMKCLYVDNDKIDLKKFLFEGFVFFTIILSFLLIVI